MTSRWASRDVMTSCEAVRWTASFSLPSNALILCDTPSRTTKFKCGDLKSKWIQFARGSSEKQFKHSLVEVRFSPTGIPVNTRVLVARGQHLKAIAFSTGSTCKYSNAGRQRAAPEGDRILLVNVSICQCAKMQASQAS